MIDVLSVPVFPTPPDRFFVNIPPMIFLKTQISVLIFFFVCGFYVYISFGNRNWTQQLIRKA